KDIENFRPYRNPLLKMETGWNRTSLLEIDNLWMKTRDSYLLSIEKGGKYILWRYRDNPGGKYEIWRLSGIFKRELKAYAIIKIEKDELFILDFFILRNMDFLKVFGRLEDFALRRKIKTIILWVNPLEEIYQKLRSLKYEEEKGIPYTLRIFEGSKLSARFFLDQYCFRMGDYDAA
ncbi:MAG: hypothetical protein AB1638_11335, partial [Nitrospirota bacterium]